MPFSNDEPVVVERAGSSYTVLSVLAMVLALIDFGAGVGMIIAIEINDWPIVSLLVVVAMWAVAVYLLLQAHEMREIRRVGVTSVGGHVETERDERGHAEYKAA